MLSHNNSKITADRKSLATAQADTSLILVVDDDPDMRFLLAQNMQKMGFRVVEAEDGQEAINIYQNLRPDVVLLDGLMPVLDGFETCARIQSLPGGSTTPILMITALNDNSSVEQAFKTGATDFITKPIHWAVLRQRVNRLLRTRRAEEALRLSDRAIMSITDGIVITDPRQLSNPIIYINAAFEQLTGYQADEILGHNWSILHGPETDPLRIEEINLAVTQENQCQVSLILYRKDSTPWWCEFSVFPVREDTSGAISHFVQVLHDVSGRKQAEEALRESERKYRTVVDNLREVIFQTDLAGNWVFLNPAWTEITGFTLEETLGSNFLNYVHPADRQRNAEMFQPLFDREKDFTHHEVRYLTRNSGSRWVEVYAQLLVDSDDNVLGVSGTLNDITERKLAEDALQSANLQLQKRVEELNRRTSEIRLLSEMGGLFQVCQNAEEAYKLVGHMMQKLFPETSGGLHIIRPTHRLVETVATWNSQGNEAQRMLFDKDDCWALRRGQLHWVEGGQSALVCRHMNEHVLPAWYLCVPMMAQGEALGVLNLYSNTPLPEGDSLHLGQNRQELAQTVGEQIALALSNLKLQETLRQQSIRDPLTALFNRRYLEEVLDKELRRATRNQRALAIIMLDIDHFKHYNDVFGHDAGDTVLRELAGFLQSSIRNEDIACRYGGEEFVLVLPEIQLDLVEQRAEQLRRSVKQLKLQHRGQPLGALSISLGVATTPTHGVTAENLLKAADTALYEAKQTGRDKVVTAHGQDSITNNFPNGSSNGASNGTTNGASNGA